MSTPVNKAAQTLRAALAEHKMHIDVATPQVCVNPQDVRMVLDNRANLLDIVYRIVLWHDEQKHAVMETVDHRKNFADIIADARHMTMHAPDETAIARRVAG